MTPLDRLRDAAGLPRRVDLTVQEVTTSANVGPYTAPLVMLHAPVKELARRPGRRRRLR